MISAFDLQMGGSTLLSTDYYAAHFYAHFGTSKFNSQQAFHNL